MKAVSKFFLGSLVALLVGSTVGRAQIAVYDFYTSDIQQKVYQPIDGNDTVLVPENFVTPLSHYQGFPATDYDNGVYFDLALPFTFVFNGQPYNTVNVAVNGWVNFGKVPLDTRDPQLLFNANLPNATIAPFFGDHFLRPDTTSGFTQSRISYSIDGSVGDRVFTIQWENLNINYLTAPDPKQSIATFQLKLYEKSLLASEPGRGNIEFHYGPIGQGLVQTSGATCGIEDENGLSFMNGLFTTVSDPFDSVRHSFRRTTTWPPSRSPGRIIIFSPFGYFIDNWGDGDADLSQGAVKVTTNDVLTILRSRAMNIPLDSVFGRQAFHGDVNHNGRFTITLSGQRINDTTKVAGPPSTGHPNEVVYFYVTSFDAAYILLYMAGKLPTLPWILDSLPPFGKLPTTVPTALQFGAGVSEENDRFVTLPIQMTGVGATSAELNLGYNSNILRLVSVTKAAGPMYMSVNDNRVALAGAVDFRTPTTVAYAKFEKLGPVNGEVVSATDLVVNDAPAKPATAVLGSPSSADVYGMYPEPFNTANGSSTIFYGTHTDGVVTLKIYDVLGNLVRTLVSAEQAHGVYSVTFDGRDGFNRPLPTGAYFYRLDADGTSKTRQMQIVRGLN